MIQKGLLEMNLSSSYPFHKSSYKGIKDHSNQSIINFQLFHSISLRNNVSHHIKILEIVTNSPNYTQTFLTLKKEFT